MPVVQSPAGDTPVGMPPDHVVASCRSLPWPSGKSGTCFKASRGLLVKAARLAVGHYHGIVSVVVVPVVHPSEGELPATGWITLSGVHSPTG